MRTQSIAALFGGIAAVLAQTPPTDNSIIITQVSLDQTNKETGAYNWNLTWVDQTALFVSTSSGASTSDQMSFTPGNGGTSIGGNLEALPSFSFGPIINGDITILVKNVLHYIEDNTKYFNYMGNATVGVLFGGETIQDIEPFVLQLSYSDTTNSP